ncbi:MAG: flagellin [Planctomycetota bacterium]
MSRINTNVNSLIAQRVFTENNNVLSRSLERLSTGFRINRGGDDPAGLIASEALRSEKAAIGAAIDNAERAEQFVNVAEGGLQEVGNLLTELQSLIGQSGSSAGLSQDEKEANQLQIDQILQTIDRIAATTSFNGTKLLNGGFDFTVSAQTSQVTDFQVNAAKIGDSNTTVQALVTQSAQQAGLFLSLGGTTLDLSTTNNTFAFEVAGALGSRSFSFSSGATIASIRDSLNAFTDVTGVSSIVSGNVIRVNSTEYGSDQFVSIDIISDGDQAGSVGVYNSGNPGAGATTGNTAFADVNSPIRDLGQDVGGTVNGVAFSGNGRDIAVTTENLDLEVTLSVSGVQAVGTIDLFTLTGGGASFNLGPDVNIGNNVTLGIQSVSARNLGSTEIDNPDSDTSGRFPTLNATLEDLKSGGALNVVDGDITSAQEVANQAINDIARLRGRLGSFQKNVVGSTISSLGVTLENVSAAESAIRDTDFAAETAELTRSQILVAASSQALQIANNQPQTALSLLG